MGLRGGKGHFRDYYVWDYCHFRESGFLHLGLFHNNPKHNPPFTRTVVLPIFVMTDRFCQAVHPILPGFRPIFEIGIFLSLCLILCNSCPIWWNKESEILMSHLKCFSLEKTYRSVSERRCFESCNFA